MLQIIAWDLDEPRAAFPGWQAAQGLTSRVDSERESCTETPDLARLYPTEFWCRVMP